MSKATFVTISLGEFERFIGDVNYPFRRYDHDWAEEYIYEVRFSDTEVEEGYVLRLYSTVDKRSDESRGKGHDAIRVVLLYQDEDKPANEYEPMKTTPHTKRTPGWERRCNEKIEELVAYVNEHKRCPDCNRPLVIRTNSYTEEQFWGCTGYDQDDPDCFYTEDLD